MSGLTGLRGAQGGVVMFGMMGQFLPAVAATIVASNPVLLGAGALFGGLQMSEDRKRKVAARRQSARQQVRQFIDDVQFEVTNEMTQLLRDLQRDLRDEFGERLAELQRTYADTAQRAQKIASQTQEQSKKRSAEIEAASAVLTKVAALAGSSPSAATEPRGAVMALAHRERGRDGAGHHQGARAQARRHSVPRRHRRDRCPPERPAAGRDRGARQGRQVDVAQRAGRRAARADRRRRVHASRVVVPAWSPLRGPGPAAQRAGEGARVPQGRRRAPCRAERHARERRAVPRRALARFRAGTRHPDRHARPCVAQRRELAPDA